MLKKWFILASILLIIGVVGSLVSAKSYFSQQDEKHDKTYRFKSSDIQSINVSNDAGLVKLSETNGDDLIVETSSSIGPVKVKVDAGLLTIDSTAGQRLTFGINFKKTKRNITIYLPKKEYQKITVSNEVGATIINSLQANSFLIESKFGKIEMNEVFSTSIHATSEVGAILINHYSGKLTVENEAGTIRIATDEVTQPLIAENEVGEINLTIKQEPKNIFISADTEIGSTRIFGERTGSYKSGNGNTTIQLSTETGSIRVTD